MRENVCKICHGTRLAVFAHTATCRDCGVLLYYPYPVIGSPSDVAGGYADWYYRSCFFNHENFTHMLRYALGDLNPATPLDILDYGGGGGQFALICKSHFPNANVSLVDINDDSTLPPYEAVNHRIRFREFETDQTRFDAIFLNDVFEHVEDPAAVLALLSSKLKPGGRIFIDTPRQFWIYPLTRLLSKRLNERVLRGTVSLSHLQIWSNTSFRKVTAAAGLMVLKQDTWSEFSMPAEYYLNNMGITNPILQFFGKLLYRTANLTVRNKIICLLGKSPD